MYTKVPNALIEAIPSMKGSVVAVCMVVCRKTLGYQRVWDKISIAQFVQATGMSNRSIIDAVEMAVANGWMIRKRDGDSYQYMVVGAEEILSSEKFSHKEDAENEISATDVCEEISLDSDMGSAKTSQGSEKITRGGSVKTSHTKESISLANASVAAQPLPSFAEQIRDVQTRLEQAKPNERQPILLEAYTLCFGKNGDTPSYGYVGKAAREVGGAALLVKYMVDLVARPPVGDKLAYIVQAHKNKKHGKPYTNGTGSHSPIDWQKAFDSQDIPDYIRDMQQGGGR